MCIGNNYFPFSIFLLFGVSSNSFLFGSLGFKVVIKKPLSLFLIPIRVGLKDAFCGLLHALLCGWLQSGSVQRHSCSLGTGTRWLPLVTPKLPLFFGNCSVRKQTPQYLVEVFGIVPQVMEFESLGLISMFVTKASML